jgi:hypothetical protein
VIGVILVVSTGYFLVNKVKQAGFDPALMEKNPGLAVAKILATVNPDIEVLGIDEDRGIIKVRDKKDGKTLTMNLADVKTGKIVFMDENNKKVEFQAKGEGDKASFEVRSEGGSMRMGAGAAQLPDWLPSYPGSEGAGTFGMNSKEGNAGSYAFKTSAAIADVVSFYENALKNEGFEVQKTENSISGQGSMTILVANHADTQRSAQITAIGAGGGTQVNLTFETKK